jgi:AraC family transcriptional regulator
MRHLAGSFYGDILADTSVAGLTLSETAYLPGLALPKHSHEQAYFCFVLGGRFTEVYRNSSRSFHPSTLIFHPAGEAHSDHFHTRVRCFNLQLTTGWLKRTQSEIINAPAEFSGGQVGYLAARLYGEFRRLDEFFFAGGRGTHPRNHG